MKNKESFYISSSSAFAWCFAQFACIGGILIAVLYFKGETQFIISIRNIVMFVIFVLFPIVSFIHAFSSLSSCFSRIHITSDGLRCTVLGKEIKKICWCDVKYCIALQTDRMHGTYIILSANDIMQQTYDFGKNKWKLTIFFLNGKKNDLFFLPYKKSVLQLLPEDFLPSRVYRYSEPLT